MIAALFTSGIFALGYPGTNGRSGEGLENNIPENGIVSDVDHGDGNLGDKDGDGVVEDKGDGNGIADDIGDMGSEIISDAGEMGSEIVSDIGEGIGIGNGAPDTSRVSDTDRTPTPSDSGMANDTATKGNGIMGLIIAIIVAIAVVILIIALIPKNRNKH